ncbi:MAG: peptidoglycan-binding domain-containing protein [candidate division NC10 bacterium]|nr:peptidoglycan-binding domain-containing protein [candidate division NC10 bacterium]
MKKVAMPILVAMSLGFVAIPASSQVIPPAPGKEIHNREQVERAQQALREKGQDPGPIDGIMGPRTKAALKDFQRAQGLLETGRLDADTMTKLGAKATPSEERMEKTPQEKKLY